MAALWQDAVGITVAGLLVGLAANALSPRGLSLGRDYFPTSQPVASRASSSHPPTAAQPTTSKHGHALIEHAEAARLFADPKRQHGRILFIDARNADRFAEGHIPGAMRFDHYRPDETAGEVVGLALIAERVVVYCNGGSCEDSELVANDLLGFGVPAEKLVIYKGGVAEWLARGMPLEKP